MLRTLRAYQFAGRGHRDGLSDLSHFHRNGAEAQALIGGQSQSLLLMPLETRFLNNDCIGSRLYGIEDKDSRVVGNPRSG